MLEPPSPQWLGRAMGGARTAPSGGGRDGRAEQGQAWPGWGGKGWEAAGAPRTGIRFGGGSAPFTPWGRTSRSSEPAGGAVSRCSLSGTGEGRKSARGSLPAWSCGCGGRSGRRGSWPGTDQARLAVPDAPPRRPGLGGRGGGPAAPGAAAMPFLHGFRRIIFEYQPLVDAILGSLGIQDPERQEPLDRCLAPFPPARRGRRDPALLPFHCRFQRGREGREGPTPPCRCEAAAEAGEARRGARAPPRWLASRPVRGAECPRPAREALEGGCRRQGLRFGPALCPVRCFSPRGAKERGGIGEGLGIYPRAEQKQTFCS